MKVLAWISMILYVPMAAAVVVVIGIPMLASMWIAFHGATWFQRLGIFSWIKRKAEGYQDEVLRVAGL